MRKVLARGTQGCLQGDLRPMEDESTRESFFFRRGCAIRRLYMPLVDELAAIHLMLMTFCGTVEVGFRRLKALKSQVTRDLHYTHVLDHLSLDHLFLHATATTTTWVRYNIVRDEPRENYHVTTGILTLERHPFLAAMVKASSSLGVNQTAIMGSSVEQM